VRRYARSEARYRTVSGEATPHFDVRRYGSRPDGYGGEDSLLTL